MLRSCSSEDKAASLSPSADGNISYYDSDALVLSSDTNSEVAAQLGEKKLQHLKQDGIVDGDKTLQGTVKAFICDAPARAFLKCIRNHNSYFACERCTVRGTYVGQVLGATALGVVARSEEEFSRLAYKDHQVDKPPLTLAGIPYIRPFALDYMHLLCLDVVRRMLHYMQVGPNTCSKGETFQII
ncbi:hypothetical protein QQF64_018732 [Cirrhinus molitorella]|uniref:Uncharacterized protein n=1 Tax=Cirrhinus molitorella TaxID=172907 RepID=A0ABR3LFW0_9TELE